MIDTALCVQREILRWLLERDRAGVVASASQPSAVVAPAETCRGAFALCFSNHVR